MFRILPFTTLGQPSVFLLFFWPAIFWDDRRHEIDTTVCYQDRNSKARSDVQPLRIGPRTVKTGCGVFIARPPQPEQKKRQARAIMEVRRSKKCSIVAPHLFCDRGLGRAARIENNIITSISYN